MQSAIFFISLLLVSQTSDATYYRFWRGMQLPELSSEQFLEGLNKKLLPASGKLMDTSARLKTYQPVTPEADLAKYYKIADEFALLEYESKESYQAYRNTPEGKAYGDLHWEMFDRAQSRSLEPMPYQGKVGFEEAYDILGKEVDWKDGYAIVRIFQRYFDPTDEEFLSGVQNYIEFVRTHSPKAVIVLVARDQVYEFSLWSSLAQQQKFDREWKGLARTSASLENVSLLVMDSVLFRRRKLHFGIGIQWQ